MHVSRVDSIKATIRELRTDFRAVKRKLEQHDSIVITDRGEPAYLLKRIPRKVQPSPPGLPDYYSRLIKRQPRPLSKEQSRRFWDEERR